MLTECRKIYAVARACSATCNNGPLIIRDSPAPLLACKLRKSSNATLYRVQANIRERQTQRERERESRKMTEHDRTNRASCNSKEKKTKKESTKKKEEVEWNNEEHEEVEE